MIEQLMSNIVNSAEQNSAVAIVIGCVAIALGIIVAAAIH